MLCQSRQGVGLHSVYVLVVGREDLAMMVVLCGAEKKVKIVVV